MRRGSQSLTKSNGHALDRVTTYIYIYINTVTNFAKTSKNVSSQGLLSNFWTIFWTCFRHDSICLGCPTICRLHLYQGSLPILSSLGKCTESRFGKFWEVGWGSEVGGYRTSIIIEVLGKGA